MENDKGDGAVQEYDRVDAILDEVIHRERALDFLVECMLERAEATSEGA